MERLWTGMSSEKLLKHVTIKLIFIFDYNCIFYYLIYLTLKWLFIQTVVVCILFADLQNFANQNLF